ncbi:MAG: P-loop NTPase [Candidatus Woesearchaeota archaeon]
MLRSTKIFYVYSTKGGVGKSTFSVNLAFTFKKLRKSVTLLDLDFSSPSIPRMLAGLKKIASRMKNFKVIPARFGGVDVVSMGFLSAPQDVSFLSGKYLEGALYQLVLNKRWQTDVVIIDMPPGFGELHRLMFAKLSGGVILITTPQNLCYDNLLRGLTFLSKLNVPIIGYVDNMAYVRCEKCRSKNLLFCNKQVANVCIDVPKLASVPFIKNIDECSNKGMPAVLVKEKSEFANIYMSLARSLLHMGGNQCLCKKKK